MRHLHPRTALVALGALLALVASGCTGTSVSIGWSGPVASEGRVHLGTIAGKVVAFEAATGRVVSSPGGSPWVFDIEAKLNKRFYATVAVAESGVFAASYDGKLYALDAATGQRRWAFQAGTKTTDTLVGDVVVGEGLILVGSSDGKLHALEATLERAKPRWSFPTGGKIWSAAAVHQGTVYVGSLDRHLYAIDAVTGQEKWRFPARGSQQRIGAVASAPVVAGATVYVGSFDHKLYALNAADGSVKWTFEGAQGWYWSRPLIDGDRIYAANLDGRVYALRDEGTRYSTPWPEPAQLNAGVRSDPVLLGSTLAVAGQDGSLHFLDVASGRQIDTQAAGAPVLAGLATDGQLLFVATTKQTLRAFDARTRAERWSIRTDQIGR